MKAHINKIKSKGKNVRERYLWSYLIIIMAVITAIWIFSLTYRLGDKKVAVKTSSEIKPFQLFINGLGNTFKDLTASVGNLRSNSTQNTAQPPTEKIIPLIPVN